MNPKTFAIAATALVTLLSIFPAKASGADTEGEVMSIHGDVLNILIRSGPAPAVGDTVSVMNVFDANGNATAIGSWRVTEVRGNDVKAVLVQSYGGEPSEGLLAYFTSSRGEGYREGPDVEVPGSASSGVPGKVTEVRGEEVTVSLDRDATPAVGDRVELSYAAGEDTISVGTWRVTGVRADGRVDAEPEEALGQPTPRMDALVFASGKKREVKTQDTSGSMTRANTLFAEAMSTMPKDPARAVALLVQAAELGHAEAAERAAIAYYHGRGVPRDYVRAAELFLQAAEAGRPEAQNYYGALFGKGQGGLARDDAQAVVWFRRSAAGGNSWAQANLCNRYIHGTGVEKNLEEAMRLCRLAEKQNNPSAFDSLGWIYQHGLGVEKNLTEAVRYYRRSAELGDTNGQNNLGYMYDKGWGVTRDYQQALHWYRQAAAQGYGHAEWNLGRLYQEGLGVPPDQAAAIEHFRRAARAGHTAAQERLQQLGQSW